MSNNEVHNINVDSQGVLVTPEQLWEALPMSDVVSQTVADSREVLANILDRKDHRLFVVVGPCSIHDTDAAMDYARRLKALADELTRITPEKFAKYVYLNDIIQSLFEGLLGPDHIVQ